MLFKWSLGSRLARQTKAAENAVAPLWISEINYNLLSSSSWSSLGSDSISLARSLIIPYNDFILTSNRNLIIIYSSRSRDQRPTSQAHTAQVAATRQTKAKWCRGIRKRNKHRKCIQKIIVNMLHDDKSECARVADTGDWASKHKIVYSAHTTFIMSILLLLFSLGWRARTLCGRVVCTVIVHVKSKHTRTMRAGHTYSMHFVVDGIIVNWSQ